MIASPASLRTIRIALAPRPALTRNRRLALVSISLAAGGLLPWMVYLGLTLPHRYEARQWSVLWIGYDAIECVVLTALAGLSWRRRHLIPLLAVVAGTLLFSDAWFDVLTSWGNHDGLFTLASAILIELPLSGLLFWVATRSARKPTDRSGLLTGEEDQLFDGGVTPDEVALRDVVATSDDDRRAWHNDGSFVEELTRFSRAQHVSRNEVVQAQRAIRRALEGLDRSEPSDQEPLRTPQMIRATRPTRHCAANLAGRGSLRCLGKS
jgi:hypothetical protein